MSDRAADVRAWLLAQEAEALLKTLAAAIDLVAAIAMAAAINLIAPIVMVAAIVTVAGMAELRRCKALAER
jgi:hypothetical protein